VCLSDPRPGFSAAPLRSRKRSSAAAWAYSPELALLAPLANVERVIVVGPGAAGKSTLAVRLGELTGLPVIELDKLFWRPGLAATPRDQWAAIQGRLAAQESWIMDGDLGPYDVLGVRLQAADTVVFLDFSLVRCAWRAIRRSRERADFWRWLLAYRRRSRPLLLQAIAAQAGDAALHVLPDPRAVRRFVAQVAVAASDASPPR
jgi:hypothetical protein